MSNAVDYLARAFAEIAYASDMEALTPETQQACMVIARRHALAFGAELAEAVEAMAVFDRKTRASEAESYAEAPCDGEHWECHADAAFSVGVMSAELVRRYYREATP